MIFKKIFSKSEFVKNTLTLTLGTSIDQFLPLLFYPVLSRIFTPNDFGLLATITSITAILTVVSTGKYEFSILIADTKQDAADIVGLIILLSASFSVLAFILFSILGRSIVEWTNNPLLQKWILVAPLIAFSIVIYNCYNEWCVRNKYFVSLSWNKLLMLELLH